MCLAHLDCISCFLPGSLRKAFWFMDPWHPRPSDFFLLKPTAVSHSPSKLSLRGTWLGHTEGESRSDMGSLSHPGMGHGSGYPYPGLGVFSQSLGGLGNPLTHSWSRHGLCPNVDLKTIWSSPFDISWKGRWRGDGPSLQHTRPAAVRRADPASSPMYHRITGLGQAPGNLRGATLTPSVAPF